MIFFASLCPFYARLSSPFLQGLLACTPLLQSLLFYLATLCSVYVVDMQVALYLHATVAVFFLYECTCAYSLLIREHTVQGVYIHAMPGSINMYVPTRSPCIHIYIYIYRERERERERNTEKRLNGVTSTRASGCMHTPFAHARACRLMHYAHICMHKQIYAFLYRHPYTLIHTPVRTAVLTSPPQAASSQCISKRYI